MAKVVRIPISGGLHTTIDDGDAPLIAGHAWQKVPSGKSTYAATTIAGRRVFMHRLLLGLPPGDPRQGDHWNGDGLDNRRQNLRAVTRSQNQANARRKDGRFKGAFFDKRGGLWMARLRYEGRAYYLGRHPTAEDAARAYDAKAREVMGPHARLNFPV